MELLRNVTTQQLLSYLEDEITKELIAEEILKLISVFLRKFPIRNEAPEDSKQMLFMKLWSHIHEFDHTKAGFSTFAFNWFRSCRTNIINEDMKTRTVRLDTIISDEGDITLLDSICDSSIIPTLHKMEIDEIINSCEDELRLWINGFTQTEISEICGISQPHVHRKIKANIRKIREQLGYDTEDNNE